MRIERKAWLVLLLLPPLSFLIPSCPAQEIPNPASDLLTLWRTYSPTVHPIPTLGASDAETSSPRLSDDDAPRSPLLATGDVLSAPNLRIDTGMILLDPWEMPDRKPRSVNQKSDGPLGSLNTQVVVTDAPVPTIWDDPLWKRTWQTNDSWQLGLAGSVAVFGQVGANSDEAGQSNMKVSGRTGLSCKLPVGSLAELTLRSGPGVSYTDPLHPLRTQGRSDWLLEVQARWPLLFGIGLEYQGSALPSLTPLQQDMVNQDLRLAVPLGTGGKLKVGAKHQWSGLLDQRTPSSSSLLDSMQLYLGLELTR